MRKMHPVVGTFIWGLVLPCFAWGQGAPTAPGNPGNGGAGTAGPPQVRVLNDLPQATSEELAAHLPIPHPGDELTDQERAAQKSLLNLRQGSPNGDPNTTPPPPAESTVPLSKSGVPRIKENE
jgi:hypothetical protein